MSDGGVVLDKNSWRSNWGVRPHAILRRDPDMAGYQFWLNKLNQFGGDFRRAEMVKAFITSGEYRSRFGSN
jgi:hypothetical protein